MAESRLGNGSETAKDKIMKELTDQDKMPFGIHRDKKMEDVPARYLHWLWSKEEGGLKDEVETSPVADYIRRNLPALMKEYPDGIWD